MLTVMLVIFLLGACVGSFLNVVIVRTHEGTSMIRGRSHCPACHKQISARDLIPIFSFFALKGRCRNCQARMSLQYPLVEFFTGILFVFFYFIEPQVVALIRDWIFISFLIVIFVYDLRYMQIPDRFTIPVMVLAVVFNLWLGFLPISSYRLGAVIIGGFFLIQYLVSKGRWIGGGDIRLGIVMGLMLGWKLGLLALLIAYVFGALVSIILLIAKKADLKSPIPFGTFLSAATIVALFAGDWILDGYLEFLLK